MKRFFLFACVSIVCCMAAPHGAELDLVGSVVIEWQRCARENMLTSNHIDALTHELSKRISRLPVTNVFYRAINGYCYPSCGEPYPRTNDAMRFTPATTRAIVDSFLVLAADHTHDWMAQYRCLFRNAFGRDFYAAVFPYYINLSTNTRIYDGTYYGNIVRLLGYGVEGFGVATNDTQMLDAICDAARVVIDFWAAQGKPVEGMNKTGELHLWPEDPTVYGKVISAQDLMARIEREQSVAAKAWLYLHLWNIETREAYEYYAAHGKPSFDYIGGKNWDAHLREYRRRVDLAEEQNKMQDQRGRPSRARKARQAEQAAVLQWLNKAIGRQVTRAQAVAYWRTLNALDARRIEWEAAEVPFDRDDYLGLATNCNGALIKDVLKQELDDSSKYSEEAAHVQGAAALLLGMYLDAMDVPWLVKYVNKAKPMALAGHDDDKYATDISRVTLFGMILNTAQDHGRREAVQACANSLRLLRDPWVRNNTREWLERVKITPDAAPPVRVKHYNQAPTAGQTTTTNAPAGR